MAGIAIDGSEVEGASKSGHITYDIEEYVDEYCTNWDEYGNCTNWGGGYWESAGSGSTSARLSPGVVSSNSHVYVEGKPVATVGDKVEEEWIADPSIPSNDSSTRYVNIKPSVSGSGQGAVSSGSSKVSIKGKKVAMIGSSVTTHLGTTTKIATGSNKISMT